MTQYSENLISVEFNLLNLRHWNDNCELGNIFLNGNMTQNGNSILDLLQHSGNIPRCLVKCRRGRVFLLQGEKAIWRQRGAEGTDRRRGSIGREGRRGAGVRIREENKGKVTRGCSLLAHSLGGHTGGCSGRKSHQESRTSHHLPLTRKAVHPQNDCEEIISMVPSRQNGQTAYE